MGSRARSTQARRDFGNEGAALSETPSNPSQQPTAPGLLRQVGLFDATMIVMGGIVGAGIFINPYVVAQQVHTPLLILGAWVLGGIIAILGAFVYAELAARRPAVGGQYAYLREAFHPVVGFLYGWVLLLVIQTGGMAAVTVTFARYLLELTGWHLSERLIVVVTLVVLTIINCLGVKLGSRMQSVLMLLKIAAIAGLIGAGLFLVGSPQPMLHPALDRPPSFDLLTAVGAAMVPVLFAFGGWQTTNFIAEEIKDPRRNLSRALVLGVAGVVVLYVGVNFVCVRTLGPQGLAETRVPATAVMRVAMGDGGARLIALGIAVSTLGFLSQSVLTAPRVYFAMARDGLFFRSVAKLTKHTHVPALAIVLQSVWTTVVALSGRYDQILNYVVSMDFLFFGLTGASLFILRSRDTQSSENAGYRAPGHPFTTGLFVLASWLVVINTIYKYPKNSLLGMSILVLGLPVYAFWAAKLKSGDVEI
ncbi:MAG TPA: amino acid permease [Verrucomicrobiae bacterium]|nr:amino acid permease [Verrucomicrobiae bacterium]